MRRPIKHCQLLKLILNVSLSLQSALALGAQLADSVYEATHLVTDKVGPYPWVGPMTLSSWKKVAASK